jgi:hypothetical protein
MAAAVAERRLLYDCRPLSRDDLQRMPASAGFRFEQLHASALRIDFEIERPKSLLWRLFIRYVPDTVYAAVGAFSLR